MAVSVRPLACERTSLRTRWGSGACGGAVGGARDVAELCGETRAQLSAAEVVIVVQGVGLGPALADVCLRERRVELNVDRPTQTVRRAGPTPVAPWTCIPCVNPAVRARDVSVRSCPSRRVAVWASLSGSEVAVDPRRWRHEAARAWGLLVGFCVAWGRAFARGRVRRGPRLLVEGEAPAHQDA